MLDRPKARVILETCSEAFAVADLALEHGHEVRVVPASVVKSVGVGAPCRDGAVPSIRGGMTQSPVIA